MVDDVTIVKKSFELYRRYGIKSVSVGQIASELGISKKTLYCHFRSRDDLLEHVIEYGKRNFFTGLRLNVAKEKSVFRKLMVLYIFLLKSIRNLNPSFMFDLRKLNTEQYEYFLQLRDGPLKQIVSEIIHEGVSKKIFQNDLDDQYIFLNQVYKILAIADRSLPQLEPEITEGIVMKLILNDIRGMTTLKGHRKFDKEYEQLLQMM